MSTIMSTIHSSLSRLLFGKTIKVQNLYHACLINSELKATTVS